MRGLGCGSGRAAAPQSIACQLVGFFPVLRRMSINVNGNGQLHGWLSRALHHGLDGFNRRFNLIVVDFENEFVVHLQKHAG